MFPRSTEVEHPLLVLIYFEGRARELTSKQCYGPLADFFDLSQAERTELRPEKGKGKLWDNHVQNARDALAASGLLHRPGDGAPRGVWRLTDRGRTEAERLALTPSFRDHPRAGCLGLP